MKSKQMFLFIGLSILLVGGVITVEVLTNLDGPNNANADTAYTLLVPENIVSNSETPDTTIENPVETVVAEIAEDAESLDFEQLNIEPSDAEFLVIDQVPLTADSAIQSSSSASGSINNDPIVIIASSPYATSSNASSDGGGGAGGASSSGASGGGSSPSGGDGGESSASDGGVSGDLSGDGSEAFSEDETDLDGQAMVVDRNLQAVREVLSGERKIANAAWWGFNELDSSYALQSAINSGASKVIVPNMGSDWIVRPIKLASNQEIVFEDGVVVEAISNKKRANSFVVYFKDWNTKKNKHRRGDSLFSAICKENITLNGYGAVLRMQKKEYMAEPKTSEHRHVIELQSCNNIIIKGLSLEDSGGDGIHIGRYHQYPGVMHYCKNIAIVDVTCDNNLRCGIAVISVDGLFIENSVLKNTIGTWPQAGIVFEPNFEIERLKNIVMRKTTIANNRSQGLVVSLHGLASNSVDVDMVFENISVTDAIGEIAASYAGIMVRNSGDKKSPGGLIKFNNTAIENIGYGLRIEKSKYSCLVSFENCVWKNIIRESPIIIQARKSDDLNDSIKFPGGVEFINCQIFDEKNRPAIKASGEIQRGKEDLYEIHGDLYVKNQNRTGSLYDWNGASLHNVDVRIHAGLFDSDSDLK